mgnify:CR=1 FL=1
MGLYIVVTQYKNDFKVYPIKAEGTPLFTAVLTLQETSKGMRPLKIRVMKEKEDEYLPIPTFIDLLKAADAILVTRTDASKEAELNDMLDGYQLESRRINVCRFCMLEDRITFKRADDEMIKFKNEFICVPCAKRELRKEVGFRGRITGAGIDRLESLLLKTRDLNRVLTLLNPSNLPPELTRYDTIPAADTKIKPVKVRDLNIEQKFKDVLLEKMETLLPVQSKSVGAGLTDGKSQLVVSATATGKTLVGEIAGINNALKGKGKMLFLVPLVALANQKYEQFKKRYGPLGLKTSIRIGTSRIALNSVKLSTSLDNDIIVGTYEGLDYILRAGQAKKLGKIGTVVIDEVHMLEDEERGHRLDGMIARLKSYAPDAQFIFLSATIGNPKEVAKGLNSTLVEYEHRPVPLERHLIFAQSHEKNRLIEEYASKEYSMVSTKGFRGQSIVFTNSRKKCHSISQSLRIQSAPYHAGLAYAQRKSVEDRFAKGELKVVVTTAALAAGVDFPASQVVFESLAMGNKWLSVGEFQQMQGRAGRPDFHDRGQIVVLADPESTLSGGETEEEIAFKVLGGSVEHINCVYEEPEQMEECLANTCISSNDRDIDRANESMFGITESTKKLLDKCEKQGLIVREKGQVKTTLFGRVIVTHFLSVSNAFLIRDMINKKVEPLDIAVELEPFDAVYFRGVEHLSKILGMNVPSRVFSPASLDIVFSGDSIAKMDHGLREQFTDFSIDFLDCVCEDAPFCGCAEKKFSKKLIEYRLQGKDPREITRAIASDYNLNTFDGDILGYLDRFLRALDAIYEIAKILGKQEIAKNAKDLRDRAESAGD